ncbi:TetR/AcrR family transcriptional regulator [Nocardia sp. NPDC050408]|uniref:TetR/AcrR family transcriptional regulator n=1 Tax=Nocardia sp. NPDC050408 TaxID=3364319 RepID=UPI003793C3A9
MTDLADRMSQHGPNDPMMPRTHAARSARAARSRQIVASAGEVFATRGYHGTSMDQLARRSGISKPTLYQYFPSKLELYLAVLQQHLDRLVSTVHDALHSTDDNHGRLSAAVHAYFDFVDDDPAGFRLVFESEVPTEPSVQWRVGQANAACIGAVHDLLIRDSGLGPQRAWAFAVGLVGASQFTSRYWLNADRPIPKEQAVEITVTLCWGGLSDVPLRTVSAPRKEDNQFDPARTISSRCSE